MKKKLLGIFICMLLIANGVIIVTADISKEDNMSKKIGSLDAPDDFELTAIAGGFAGWTELFKLELNSDGEGKYYWMYPEDRDTQTWTLMDEFTLTSSQMDELWDEIVANDFFNMDSLYKDPKWHDGSYAELTITGNGQTHTVRTENIIIIAFNAMMRKINEMIPGDNGLFYNAVTDEELNQPPGKPDKPSGTTNGKAGTSYNYETSGTEPEYDDMWYLFDWGDGTDSGWLGTYKPGDIVSASHTWSSRGNYQVKVKAKDYLDAESPWSDPLSISMPKSKQISYPLFRLFSKILERFNVFRNLIVSIESYEVVSQNSIETSTHVDQQTLKTIYYVDSEPKFEIDDENELPLYVESDDIGKNTSVEIDGCKITVSIYIEIFGKGASQPIADKIKSGIEKVWNKDPATGKDWVIECKEKDKECPKKTPGCTVNFDAIVKLQKDGKPRKGYHQVEIKDHNDYPGGFHRSSATEVPPDGQHQGEGEWDTNDTEEVFAHEAGHLMGQSDKYDEETGVPLDDYENNIMGTTKSGAKPNKAQVEDIVHKGGVWCPCDCCPEAEDNDPPKNKIITPQNGEPVSTPAVVQGWADDGPDGTGVALLSYALEWDEGSYDGADHPIDPPLEYVSYEFGPIYLENYIEVGDWITITTYATDAAGNTGSDSVTVTWEEEEDTTPPVTDKNIEEQYEILPFTEIILEATDDMSGVHYIHYDIWWDSDGDMEIDTQMADENIPGDIAIFTTADYGILNGLIQLKYYAEDNAQNQEEPHQQYHFVIG